MRTGTWLLAVTLAVGTARGVEYVSNGGFEDGTVDGWQMDAQDGSTLSLVVDSTPPNGGGAALGVNVSGETRKSGVSQNLPAKAGPGTYVFSAWIDTSRLTIPSGYVMCYLSGRENGVWKNYGGFSTGGTHPKIGWRNHPWKRFEHRFTVPAGGEVGAVNLQFVDLKAGTVMFDSISLREASEVAAEAASAGERRDEFVSLVPGGEHALYLPDELPTLTLTLTNPTPDDLEFACTTRTIDYFGVRRHGARGKTKVPAGGAVTRTLRYPQFDRPGFYCTTLEWTAGRFFGTAEGSFVRVAAPPAAPDPLFGISCFCENEAEFFRRLGVGMKSAMIQWRYLEDANGRPDFEAKAREIRAMREKGVAVGGHISVFADFTCPLRYLKANPGPNENPIADPEKYLADLEVFVRAAATRFKDDIRDWSCGGEINLILHRGPWVRPFYIAAVKAIARGVHAADPSLKVLALGCSGADGREQPRYRVVRDLLPELKDDIDGLGIDQYTDGQTYGEGYVTRDSEQAELREIMQTAIDIARGSGKDLVTIEEKGPSVIRETPISSPRCIRMANVVARDYIILKTLPEVKYWLYYRPFNWQKDTVVDWGMWERGSPRQVVSAYAATARQMCGARFAKGVDLHPDIPCWLFTVPGGAVATLWYNGADALDFRLTDAAGLSVADVQGNPADWADGVLRLGEAPVYLRAKDVATLERALASARYSVPELKAVVETVARDRTLVAVRNVSGRPVTAQVKDFTSEPKVATPAFVGESISIRPGETKTLEFAASPKSCAFRLASEGGRSVSVTGAFEPYVVRRVGGWDDLAATGEIVLEDLMRYMPGFADMGANGLCSGPKDASARARFGYDDEAFYLEFRVQDDRLFRGDAVSFAFDVRKDARLRALRGEQKTDVLSFTVAADGKGVTRDEKAKRTVYRIRKPFAELKPLRPVPGKVFGFSFAVTDRDSAIDAPCRVEATPGDPPDPTAFRAFVFE